ncbi:MAG: PKD domain-containing protein [Thermoplasmata archaeon]|nr:PKD domain-containing protein [Thermoplasmata archaeon]
MRVRTLRGVFVLGGLLSLGLLCTAPIVGGTPPPTAQGCSAGLTLSLHPTAGNAPLVVAYELTALGVAPSAIDWSFGDGSYFNGTGTAYFAPIHRFDHPGSYTTIVSVTQGSQTGQCAQTLAVSSGALRTLATVVPKSGVAPLTVDFSATVIGGSGTFRSATWTFGNGQVGSGFNLSYTYAAPGSYLATFQVTDSANASSSTTLMVNVSGPASASPTSPLGGVIPWLTGGVLAAGLVVVGIVLYTRSFYGDRAGRHGRITGATSAPPQAVLIDRPPEGPRPIVTSQFVRPELAAAPPSGPSLGPVPLTIPRPRPEIEPALPPIAPVLPAPAPPEQVERLRLSQRVVLHLYSLGTLHDDEIAPPTFTQAGMSDRLEVGQSPLSNVLRRLVIAGVLSQDVRHVRGRPRRLRVYRLTSMGESLALELRRQRENLRVPPGRGPAS